ncbi:NAD(P)-dependent alcohol dehydrogenase [Bradyrhizobium liaoningense]
MQALAAIRRNIGKPFELQPVVLPAPRSDEVLVKVVATGLCHTDLSVRDGELPMPLPSILGHEGAGVVAAVGSSVRRLSSGTPVVMSFSSCGECNPCLLGKPSDCVSFFASNFSGHRPDGCCYHTHEGEKIFSNFFGQSSFCTYAVVNERNLVPVPPDLPLESLGPLGCGLMTGAGAILNSLRPRAGSSLAVFGLGAVGMAALMAGKICGCDPLIAVDVKPTRLSLARELGATHAINAVEMNAVETIKKITGLGADHIVEAIGRPEAIDGCVAALRSRGSGILLGAPRVGQKLTLESSNLLRGITLKSVVEGDAVPRVFIPELIDLHRKGKFPFDRLLQYFDFVNVNEAAASMARGEAIKPVLRMPH